MLRLQRVLRTSPANTKILPQQGVVICKTCKHYKTGLCMKFVGLDLCEGIEVPVSAFEGRSNQDLCGKEGIYHEPKDVEVNTSMSAFQEPVDEFHNP